MCVLPILLIFLYSTVNGGWGDFGAWEDCPVSCGGAEHSRYRVCDSPLPEHGGDDCTIDGSTDIETEKCNENPCPSKLEKLASCFEKVVRPTYYQTTTHSNTIAVYFFCS